MHGSTGGRWRSAAPRLRRTRNLRVSVRYRSGTTNSQRPTSPLLCFADATGEALSAMLRPGNAGANTVTDHLDVLDGAVAQLPVEIAVGHRDGDDAATVRRAVQARADSAGCTHGFVHGCRARNIGFVGHDRR